MNGATGEGPGGADGRGAVERCRRRTEPYRSHSRTAAPRTARVLAALATAAALLLPLAAPARADAVRDLEWGLKAVQAPQAWRTTRGSGVTVAVLDTGVDADHPDLRGQVGPGKDFVGFGAHRGNRAWARHGTAMAGIIAGHGHGDDGGEGIRGVAPEARILPVRVILEDSDPQRKKARSTRGGALAKGIRWATDHGADVINLSLGDDSKSAHPEQAEDAAVQYALGKGVVVVSSAGNSGEKGDHVSYPAAYPGVIAVTAVDRDGHRAAFSTRRWYATVCAPGVDVVIADPDRSYYEGWGTSAAAAFVSGVAALVRAAHPDLSPRQVKSLLQRTARYTPEGGRSDALGAGMVDAAAAVTAGGRLEPEPERPEPADYRSRYFGLGPIALGGGPGGGPGAPAIAAGVCGAALLAAGWLVWRGPRRREPESGRIPSSGGAEEDP